MVLRTISYNVFCETLFVNHEQIEEQRQVERKKLKEQQKKEELERIPQDLQRIEIVYVNREAKNRDLDERDNFHPDEQILEMRKENFIKRNLTEYQRRQLYPKSDDPKEDKRLRKIEKESIKKSHQEMEKWRMSKVHCDYKMLPQAILACIIVVIVEISDEIFRKLGLNSEKVVNISCVSLIGYAVYLAI